MEEKVFGFREKDIKNHIWTECKTNKKTIEIRKILGIHEEMDIVKRKEWNRFHKEIKLVPAVSIEWLENIIERKKYLEAPSVGKQDWVINVEHLLKVIREQVKPKEAEKK